MAKMVCWKCGASLKEVPWPITRHSNCLECYAELHCCRMCKSYDTRYISKCSDERADSVVSKDTANFCEWFKPRPGAYAEQEDAAGKAAESDLKALFGEDNGSEPPEESPPSELDTLFGEDDD